MRHLCSHRAAAVVRVGLTVMSSPLLHCGLSRSCVGFVLALVAFTHPSRRVSDSMAMVPLLDSRAHTRTQSAGSVDRVNGCWYIRVECSPGQERALHDR